MMRHRQAAGAVAARGLEHRKRAINIGAKICFRLLDRGNDVGASRKMENPFGIRARRIDGAHIGNVGLDDLEPRIAVVLVQISCAGRQQSCRGREHGGPRRSDDRRDGFR